ncbi:MAG: type II toxin-antitoxin system VapC family toxin [Chloroflexi bacterium]|nr:type II toxin-antitoxin system VapC family toxin [Chloroflexota bacterium]
MKILLDTYTFIWMVVSPRRLPRRLYEAIVDPANILALSIASMWEMQIKYQLGKLELPASVPNFVTTQLQINDIQTLTVLDEHIWALDKLPLHHRDPFDRLLIAQAIVEGYRLASVDAVFREYPVELFPG